MSIEKKYYLNLQLFAGGSEEKTEEATPKKKQDSRKKGQVAKSQDLNAAISLMMMVSILYWGRGFFSEHIHTFFNHILSKEMLIPLTDDQVLRLFALIVKSFTILMAPILIMAVILGFSVNLGQVGFLFSAEIIKPKFNKLNPIEGFKKIFSKRSLVEFVKSLLKITIVGIVVFILIKNRFQSIFFLTDMDLLGAGSYIASLIYHISLGVGLIFMGIAILDIAYQRWDFKQSIKMSKYEIKQEMKQSEGDPQIKSKVKEKQRQMAMGRMMENIPDATVVVTNPTHFAIALKYEDDMEAPQVIAKGKDYIAQKIKEKAKEFDIPIIENKPVARALYKSAEIDDYIPVELYQAVAEILAALYKSGKR